MQTYTTHTAYIDNRPLRIAFLVDPNQPAHEHLDTIIAYNHTKWGGRYNPVILTDGETITDYWWQLLQAIDPDVIHSHAPLSDSLVERIDSRLSPISVQVPVGIHPGYSQSLWPTMLSEGVSILPTPANVRQLAGWLNDKAKVIAFELAPTVDRDLERFVKVNFGTFTRDIHTVRQLEQLNVQVVTISSAADLATALEQFSTFEQFIYRSEFCTLSDFAFEVENYSSGPFTVVIGDTPDDLAYFWNRAVSTPTWKRHTINQLWIPTAIIRDPLVARALGKWTWKMSGGGGAIPLARFKSLSLMSAELESFAVTIATGIQLGVMCDVTTDIEVPRFPDYHSIPPSDEALKHFEFANGETTISIPEPDVLQAVMAGEHWMVDVYIRSHPDEYRMFQGRDFWYQLPLHNKLAHRTFSDPSRVTARRYPAVMMQRGKNSLTIRMLGEDSIFKVIGMRPNTPYFGGDSRSHLHSEYGPYYDMKHSGPGRYLNGFLEVFSGLPFAYQTLKDRYWRRLFDTLSSLDPSKQENRLTAIGNKLKKAQFANMLQQEDGARHLAEYVLDLSKQEASAGTELPFKHFVEQARSEYNAYTAAYPGTNQGEFNEDDVKSALSDLVETNVLMMGIRPQCRRCGSSYWYSISDLSHTISCQGCAYQYSTPAEANWYYRLNSLVQNGYAKHGLVPVVLALGKLLEYSRTSFFRTGSWEFFDKGSADATAEVDLMCIQDGMLILGEVKQSATKFKDVDFDRMLTLARALRPDYVIYSAIGLPNWQAKHKLEEQQLQLADLGIEVSWYDISDRVDAPSLVR